MRVEYGGDRWIKVPFMTPWALYVDSFGDVLLPSCADRNYTYLFGSPFFNLLDGLIPHLIHRDGDPHHGASD